MPLRTCLSSLAVLALIALQPLRAANLDGSTAVVGDAEAERLYSDANDLVTNVVEGQYSYAYMQFYWRRAESFVERAERVYPDSPTGRALKAGRLKVGPFDLDYFKNRALPRLEEKRTYAVDAVTCANFLYELDKTRNDDAYQAAFAGIIEVMSRQERWGEVLAFPTKPNQRVAFFHMMFREAARSRYDEHLVIARLLKETAPGMQADAGFLPSLAESYVFLGNPRGQIAAFVAKNPRDDVKLAVLHAMVEREVQIRRRIALKLPLNDSIDAIDYTLLNLGLRDDVAAEARQLFPGNLPQAAQELLATYQAALGDRPADDTALGVRLAYLEYLGLFEKFDELEAYARTPNLPDSDRRAYALKAIEMYAQAGRLADAERYRAAYAIANPERADEAELAEFRGQMDSIDMPLSVREKTFSSLPLKDPCVLARAIMEWSLTPNRSIRGAGPWDSVVLKYEPGFDNLPLPKSDAVRDAANAINPY